MRRARLGAAARLVLGAVLLIGVLFVGVFPTRTFLDQRDAIDTTKERLAVLRSENERLREQIQWLQKPEEIERIAREEFNLAKPGERVFVMIPSELEALRRHGGPAKVLDAIREAWGIPPTTSEAG